MGIGANTEIAGKLRLVRALGQGSTGQVWLARHLDLGSEVAVKFLNRDVSLAPTARERFIREARTIGRVRSPHVVQVHDFGFHEEHAYLVMEYLVGETLEARLERVGVLTVEQVARICTQIAKALQKAHDAGLIHRDIKPANVFLVDYGDEEIAKVVDFGTVKSTGSSLNSSTMDTLTQAGAVIGTPYYMSPEQIQDSGMVGPQADLWALGVIAYESLVGQLPFTAPNFAQLVVAICRDPIPVPSTIAAVPPAFDAWVARALNRNLLKRFQSAKELARELCQALLFGSDQVPMPDGVVPPDLLWSGAYSSTAAGGSSPGHAADSLAAPISVSGSDPPSSDDTIRMDPEPSNAGIPDAVISSALLPGLSVRVNTSPSASQDGSLASQVAPPHAPAPQARSSLSRAVLLGVGAVILLAAGWFANRYTLVHSGPQPAAALASHPELSDTTPTSSAAAPHVSTPAAPPSASSAAASGSIVSPPPAIPAAHSVAARAPRLVQSSAPNTAQPPTAAPTQPAAQPTSKGVDPLEERQ